MADISQNSQSFYYEPDSKEEDDDTQKEEDPEYERLNSSKFMQQRFPAWRHNPKISTIAIVFIIFGVIDIIIGIILLVFSKKAHDIEIRYDNIPECKIGYTCNVTIKFKENMEKNIFIYYEIDGLSQNHRRYKNSKSDAQLKGESFTLEKMNQTEDCYPALTNKEMGFSEGKKSITGVVLNMSDLAVPCGLMVKSYFSDVFKYFYLDGEDLKPNETEIAWKNEIKNYKNTEQLEKQWINMTDEHFIAWMRPSPFTDVKKLWGKIENKEIKPGQNLVIQIENNYDVSSFDGKKKIILSNINVFGSRNDFLGISYCCLGSIVLVTIIIIIICFPFHIEKMKES